MTRVFDDEDVLQELDGGGNVVAAYLHGPGIDDPITMLRDVDGNHTIDHDTEVWHFTKDTLGSIKELTNPLGQVVQRYRYDSYGLQTLELDESRLDSKEIPNPYAFTGRELDREIGLQYHRARYYDAGQGAWISPDPIGILSGDLNFYRFVRNRPTQFRDPYGLSERDVKEIIDRLRRTVRDLSDVGSRRPGSGSLNGALNNLESLLPGSEFLGCGDQAFVLQQKLEGVAGKGAYDDVWFFEVVEYGAFHKVVLGYSNNPNDPILILDPWADRFERLKKEQKQ